MPNLKLTDIAKKKKKDPLAWLAGELGTDDPNWLENPKKSGITVRTINGEILTGKDAILKKMESEELFFFSESLDGPYAARRKDGKLLCTEEQVEFEALLELPKKPDRASFFPNEKLKANELNMPEISLIDFYPQFEGKITETAGILKVSPAKMDELFPKPKKPGFFNRIADGISRLFGGKGTKAGQDYRKLKVKNEKERTGFRETVEMVNNSRVEKQQAANKQSVQPEDTKKQQEREQAYQDAMAQYLVDMSSARQKNPILVLMDVKKNGFTAENTARYSRFLEKQMDGKKTSEVSKELLAEYLLVSRIVEHQKGKADDSGTRVVITAQERRWNMGKPYADAIQELMDNPKFDNAINGYGDKPLNGEDFRNRFAKTETIGENMATAYLNPLKDKFMESVVDESSLYSLAKLVMLENKGMDFRSSVSNGEMAFGNRKEFSKLTNVDFAKEKREYERILRENPDIEKRIAEKKPKSDTLKEKAKKYENSEEPGKYVPHVGEELLTQEEREFLIHKENVEKLNQTLKSNPFIEEFCKKHMGEPGSVILDEVAKIQEAESPVKEEKPVEKKQSAQKEPEHQPEYYIEQAKNELGERKIGQHTKGVLVKMLMLQEEQTKYEKAGEAERQSILGTIRDISQLDFDQLDQKNGAPVQGDEKHTAFQNECRTRMDGILKVHPAIDKFCKDNAGTKLPAGAVYGLFVGTEKKLASKQATI